MNVSMTFMNNNIISKIAERFSYKLAKDIDNHCFEYMRIKNISFNDMSKNTHIIKYIDKPFTEHYFYKDKNIFDVNLSIENCLMNYNIVSYLHE